MSQSKKIGQMQNKNRKEIGADLRKTHFMLGTDSKLYK
jgi:hypothetical protein